MIKNNNSLQVSIDNGTTWLSLAPYLVQVETGYNKLWSSDTGRNLAGKTSGTLIGIFPKFICQFRPLTANEIHTLAPYLDSPLQKVKYDDDNSGTQKTINTYTGDWSVVNEHINVNEGFSCSFIATERRT